MISCGYAVLGGGFAAMIVGYAVVVGVVFVARGLREVVADDGVVTRLAVGGTATGLPVGENVTLKPRRAL